MNFYDEWECCLLNNKDDRYYINSFLYKTVDSIVPLEKSSKKQIKKIIEFLLAYNKQRIIDMINDDHIKLMMPYDIAQFSNFEKSTNEITHILKYEPNGLTFEELGYLLNSSSNKLAATKYGENQSKTARIFSFVTFTNSKPTIVKNTSLGNEFPLLNKEDQDRLISILSLRDPMIKCFIASAKTKNVKYEDIICCLSETTTIRRKTNVHTLLSKSLVDNDNILKKIII